MRLILNRTFVWSQWEVGNNVNGHPVTRSVSVCPTRSKVNSLFRFFTADSIDRRMPFQDSKVGSIHIWRPQSWRIFGSSSVSFAFGTDLKYRAVSDPQKQDPWTTVTFRVLIIRTPELVFRILFGSFRGSFAYPMAQRSGSLYPQLSKLAKDPTFRSWGFGSDTAEYRIQTTSLTSSSFGENPLPLPVRTSYVDGPLGAHPIGPNMTMGPWVP